MKRLIFTVAITLLTFSSTGLMAQDDTECMKYLSYYKEYYKQKSYDEAIGPWRKAYSICRPNIRETMYTEGTMLIRQQIKKNAKNPSYKKELIDTLITLHKQRLQYFPKNRTTILNNLATDYIQYYNSDNGVIFDNCSPIVDELGAQAKPATLLAVLKAAIELYKEGSLETETVLDTYDDYMGYISQMEQTELVTNIKSGMEELFISSKVADCESLIKLFTPRFAAEKNDVASVSKIVKMMSKAEDCTDNQLFYNAVTALYKLDPSYQSAYYLYKLSAAKGDVAVAIKYLEGAIDDAASDAATDAQYSLEMSQYCLKNSRLTKAASAANQAIAKSGDDVSIKAKANYVLGMVWGSIGSDGGSDEVQNRAHYWVAVDYLERAKRMDASLADDCSKMIAAYKQYFPNAADAFMYNVVEGQEVTVKREGLTATTTARLSK